MTSGEQITSRTLLERVRDPADRVAWERFYGIYAPLIERFAATHGLSHDEIEDVRDESLARVAAKLPEFEYDPRRGGFRGWLYRIVRGKVVDHLRRAGARNADTRELQTAPDPSPTPDEVWERLWREEHLRYALREVAEHVSERTYQTFRLLLVDELTVADVCERMGMNANQVYKAKARGLAAVRGILERLGVEPDA